MSAKRANTSPDGRQSDASDPHGIIPESFLERYEAADSIREALRMAEREVAADWVDREDRPRCPNEDCHSTRIRKKLNSIADQSARKDGDWKCWNCGDHFNTPAPPESEVKGKQLRLSEVSK